MPFVESHEIPGKPWGTETVLDETDEYALKRLVYVAGHQGGFQYHEKRAESFTLTEGAAVVSWVDEDGEVHARSMRPGDTFRVPRLTPHKFHSITTCVVYEASVPGNVRDDRVNVAHLYGDDDGEAR